MTDKKTIKQLMAIGCQRNDAAAFARAYRKIKAAKREDLFPGIVEPAMPVNIVHERVNVREMRATIAVPTAQVRFYGCTKEFAERVTERLVDEISKGLAQSGAIKIQKKDPAHLSGTPYGMEEYVASIRVVMPGEADEYV